MSEKAVNSGSCVASATHITSSVQKVVRSAEFYREIGRKGGLSVSKNKEHMANIGKRGGEAISKNRSHMSEIGHKGGEKRAEKLKQMLVK